MKILIIGSGGRLGAALMRAYQGKFDVTGFSHAQIDLADFDELEELLMPLKFDVVINCAAMTNVDMCEEQPDQAFRINAGGPDILAGICETKNARLIHFSTDYVFDGEKQSPYLEEDEAEPVSVYGQSKREGEEAVLAAGDRHLVVRVSWVFGPDRPSFIDNIIQRARENKSVAAVADKFSTPSYTRDLAEMLLGFLDADQGATGILHLSNSGECSWQQYAQHALDCCQEAGIPLKSARVEAMTLADMQSWIARRPRYSVLSTSKYTALSGAAPRSWKEAVADYVRDFVKK